MAAYDGKYVTSQEVRDEGISLSQASEETLNAAIVSAERFVEANTGRWFYRRQAHTLVLDGGDKYEQSGLSGTTDILFISVPIIALTSVAIDSISQNVLDFIVMNRIGPPKDDRANPRIISKNSMWPTEGVQNIQLVGDFGYVEETTTYTVPSLIRTAARKLAIRFCDVKMMAGPEGVERELELKQGYIVEEKLPGYSYRLAGTRLGSSPVYCGDPEIDSIIDQYRYKVYTRAV